MDKYKKQTCNKGKCTTSHPQEPLQNEKTSVPGQQIGLYNDADKGDVKQMVRMLNSPEEESQQDRG